MLKLQPAGCSCLFLFIESNNFIPRHILVESFFQMRQGWTNAKWRWKVFPDRKVKYEKALIWTWWVLKYLKTELKPPLRLHFRFLRLKCFWNTIKSFQKSFIKHFGSMKSSDIMRIFWLEITHCQCGIDCNDIVNRWHFVGQSLDSGHSSGPVILMIKQILRLFVWVYKLNILSWYNTIRISRIKWNFLLLKVRIFLFDSSLINFLKNPRNQTISTIHCQTS